jgi:hypothetical protein
MTLIGKVGKCIKGSRNHYTEARTQKGEVVYSFSCLVNDEWCVIATQSPLIIHLKPFEEVEMQGDFNRNIFVAERVNAKTHKIKNIY